MGLYDLNDRTEHERHLDQILYDFKCMRRGHTMEWQIDAKGMALIEDGKEVWREDWH